MKRIEPINRTNQIKAYNQNEKRERFRHSVKQEVQETQRETFEEFLKKEVSKFEKERE